MQQAKRAKYNRLASEVLLDHVASVHRTWSRRGYAAFFGAKL
jgi:hypothetical protein